MKTTHKSKRSNLFISIAPNFSEFSWFSILLISGFCSVDQIVQVLEVSWKEGLWGFAVFLRRLTLLVWFVFEFCLNFLFFFSVSIQSFDYSFCWKPVIRQLGLLRLKGAINCFLFGGLKGGKLECFWIGVAWLYMGSTTVRIGGEHNRSAASGMPSFISQTPVSNPM